METLRGKIRVCIQLFICLFVYRELFLLVSTFLSLTSALPFSARLLLNENFTILLYNLKL
jgi:hypothetical protein